MGGYIQRVIANGSMSKWKPVTSDIHCGSVLGLTVFNIFINDSKFEDATKRSDAVDSLEGRDASQRDSDRL